MSTNIEPVVAHDEKSKFFMSFPEIAHGKHSNVVSFFSWNILFNPPKNKKIRHGPTSGQKHAKFSDQYLQFEPGNFFLRSLQVFWGQLYFFGLIFKATTSRLKSVKFAS